MSTPAAPWAKYAATDGPWTRYGDAAPVSGTGTAQPDTRNKVQQAFDELTNVTPQQEAGHSPIVNKAQEFGAGAIQSLTPLVHPLDTLSSLGHLIAHPIDTAKAMGENAEEHPAQFLGNLTGAAVFGGGAEAAGGKALEMLPSKARAGATLSDIRNQAKDVQVVPSETMPELSRFQELTQRGGATAKPATQLSNRLRDIMVPRANTQPFNFPEARDFYSNISSQSAEDASRLNPIMRRQMGAVRSGMHEDLTNAADQVGRGQDYADAVREYGRAMRLREILSKGGKYAIGAAGLGLAGHYLKDMVPHDRRFR